MLIREVSTLLKLHESSSDDTFKWKIDVWRNVTWESSTVYLTVFFRHKKTFYLIKLVSASTMSYHQMTALPSKF